MLTGSTLIRVVPNPAGGWDVREPGSSRALRHAAGKDDAVRRARAAMLSGGVVQVLDAGGFLLESFTVPGPSDSPWWYTRSRTLSWMTGSLFVLLGIFGVAGRNIGEFRFWLGLAQLLLGGFTLVLLIKSRRRDRRLMESERAKRSER